jgi:hypothetical protein
VKPTVEVAAFYAALGLELLGGDGAQEPRLRCRLSGHMDEHPSCRVHPTRGVWYCDVCARGGGPFQAAVELAGRTPTETRMLLRVHRLGS